MSAKPIYEFDRTTTSTDAVPAALQGSIYWYDTETLENSEAVYYEPTDTYALWNHGTGWIVTVGADVGSLVADVFLFTFVILFHRATRTMCTTCMCALRNKRPQLL